MIEKNSTGSKKIRRRKKNKREQTLVTKDFNEIKKMGKLVLVIVLSLFWFNY